MQEGSGEPRATERLLRFQTSQKPDLFTKELDNEEDCNSDTQAAPDDHDFSARLHVRIMQLLGDLLEPHGRLLEGAFVDLVVQGGDALAVDVRGRILDPNSAAGGEHNLVRLHVNEEVVAWRPGSSIHLQNIALSESLHTAITHLFAGSAAILRPSDFIELAFLTKSAGSAAP